MFGFTKLRKELAYAKAELVIVQSCLEISRSSVDKLTVKVDARERDIIALNRLVKSLENTISDKIFTSPLAVNFNKINATSIERMLDHRRENTPVTVIGYLLPNTNEVREWYFNCTQTEHDTLVEKFIEYMKESHA